MQYDPDVSLWGSPLCVFSATVVMCVCVCSVFDWKSVALISVWMWRNCCFETVLFLKWVLHKVHVHVGSVLGSFCILWPVSAQCVLTRRVSVFIGITPWLEESPKAWRRIFGWRWSVRCRGAEKTCSRCSTASALTKRSSSSSHYPEWPLTFYLWISPVLLLFRHFWNVINFFASYMKLRLESQCTAHQADLI